MGQLLKAGRAQLARLFFGRVCVSVGRARDSSMEQTLVWKPGTSGNPTGKSKMKLLSDDLRRLLTQNPARIRRVTEKLVEMAEEGDLTAIQMLMDRLEGKPVQSIEIDQTVTQLPREQRFARLLEMQAKVIPSTAARPAAPAAQVSPVKQITSGTGNGSGN